MLRAYLVDGRLTGIPAQGRKRQVILAVPARAGVHRGPGVSREGGQPADRAVPPRRRGAPALPVRRAVRGPRPRPLHAAHATAAASRSGRPGAAGRGPASRARSSTTPSNAARTRRRHRLDQPVVAVRTPVEEGDPLVLGVDEQEEVVAELVHGEPAHPPRTSARSRSACVLTMLRFGAGRPTSRRRSSLSSSFASGGRAPQAGLLLVRDGQALDLVREVHRSPPVAPRRQRGCAGSVPSITSVISAICDALGAAVVLDRELDDGVRTVIEEALEARRACARRSRGHGPEPRGSCP